jgi:hypothetical protein
VTAVSNGSVASCGCINIRDDAGAWTAGCVAMRDDVGTWWTGAGDVASRRVGTTGAAKPEGVAVPRAELAATDGCVISWGGAASVGRGCESASCSIARCRGENFIMLQRRVVGFLYLAVNLYPIYCLSNSH